MNNTNFRATCLPSWAVVGTMDEPAALIAAWVAHHLSIGAAEVHVFLDHPDPEAEALLTGLDRVQVYQSGDDGWAMGDLCEPPTRHQDRQKYNATRALLNTSADWMIHCDADEFVCPDRSLAEELAGVDPSVDYLVLPVEERAFTTPDPATDIFAGAFRRQLANFDEIGPEIYGDERTSRLNSGLSGHVIGKSCARTGRDNIFLVHRPVRASEPKANNLPRQRSEHAWLVHFDGLTCLHFVLKMLRYKQEMHGAAPAPAMTWRWQQGEAAFAMIGDTAMLTQLWWSIQGISQHEASQLFARGVLVQPKLDLVARTRALFGDRVDLSPAAFDRALVAQAARKMPMIAAQAGFDPVPLMARGGAIRLA